MNEVMMLDDAEPGRTLRTIIEKKVPAIMSYSSRGKWHVVKVLPTGLGANRFDVEVSPRIKPHPLNIHVDQPVGMSVKYGCGKFIFESRVLNFEPSPEATSGGRIILAVPERIEMVQRRSYFRVEVPAMLDVNVSLWHRCHADGKHRVSPEHCWQGKLIDISAGGAQIAVDAAHKPDFRKGQFIKLQFIPMPYEAPLEFGAQIRSILPTADDKNICFGLQMVGLEASSQGRSVLQRLCNIAEQYHRINQSSAKQHDFQRTSL
jgi:hypothetical protein